MTQAYVTIRLTRRAVKASFREHARRYDVEGAWKIDYHVEMWRLARRARTAGTFEAFEPIYEALAGPWLAFRPQPNPKTARQVFGILRKVDPSLRSWSLATVAGASPAVVRSVWQALVTASSIKRNTKSGPSVVAISKFLHFWNPRLFVIVDRQVMRDLVFAHRWLARDLDRVRAELELKVPDVVGHPEFATDLGDYLVALVWAGRLLASTPAVNELFQAHLARDAKRNGYDHPKFAGRLESAAVEWLLLGLVELPPAGVSIPAG